MLNVNDMRKKLKVGPGYCACSKTLGPCDYHMATNITGAVVIAEQLGRED